MEEKVQAVCEKEAELIAGEVPWKFSYGTAGFRDKCVTDVHVHSVNGKLGSCAYRISCLGHSS